MKARTLIIDLSSREVTEQSVDSGPWLGGRGLGTRLLVDHCDPGCDPLGPDNVMVIALSPLTGTTAPTAGRGHAVFKSPLTGGIGSANSGGRWGKVLKSTGYDALVIKGASDKPVYLSISEGKTLTERVSIRDAGSLWGRDAHATTDSLLSTHGDKASVLTIGPAGENRVLFASIMNDRNRAYGRGGPGAALGAKKLKAVVVNGNAKTEVADAERLKLVVEQTRHVMKAAPTTKRVMRELGTAGLVHLINFMGILPHRNFKDCAHREDLLDQISGEAVTAKILIKAGACFGCPIMCQRHTRVGDHAGEGPEYESMALMGPAVDIYNLEAITLGGYAANELGMDTISLGGALACAAELFEEEALSPADFGGDAVRFGDAGIYPEIVKQIAERRGLGDLIALGSREMARRAGRPELAMAVKGLELPAYDPRGMPSQALGYMTSPTGACHLRGGYSVSLAYFGGYKEVPRYLIRQAALTAINQQNAGIIQDSLGICRFTGYAVGMQHWARIFSAVTGESVDSNDLERAAERIATLERMFNNHAGLTRADDDLPARFKNEPIPIDGKGRVVSEADRERMLDDYYSERGWDHDGEPLPETLGRLGL